MRAPLVLLLLVCGLGASAQDAPLSWKGQLVIGTKPDKDIRFGNRVNDKYEWYEFQGIYPITVREEKDGWLCIFDGHREGWANKADFVLSRDAPAYFSNRVRANPSDGWAWYMRAMGWRHRGEYDKAIKDYDEAIRLDPMGAASFMGRGNAWRDKGDLERALKDFDEAIRLDPKNALAFVNRGTARADKGDPDRALRDYDEAIRLDPKHALAFVGRGNAWRAKGDLDRALKDFDEAIRLDPKGALAFNNRGVAWGCKGDLERALKDFDEAIRLDPKDADAFNNRGAVWQHKGNVERALKDYDEAIRLDPNYAFARFGRATTLLLARRPGAAEGCRTILERQGWKSELSAYAVILGHLAARAEKDEAAAKKFLADADGKLKAAWPEPIVSFLRGDLDEAALLKLATDRDKETDARAYLGFDHLLRGRTAEARAHFRWLLESGAKTRIGYTIAVVELARLEKAHPPEKR